MSEERRLLVLRAIVEDYVATQEPVGSRMLTERHHLGVSPATIRNDMAALEEAGLIAQPHTSAGRIPTDLGYRLFVDRLAGVRPLTTPQRRAIEQFLSEGMDLDDVLSRAGRLVAQLTGQVAVVQYPSLSRTGLRHLEFVPVGGERLLVVIISENGAVEQRFVEFPPAADGAMCDEASLGEIRARFNAAAAGRRASELDAAFTALIQQLAPDLQPLATRIAAAVLDAMQPEADDRLVLAGTANLARASIRFEQGLQPVLEALEEQVVLLGLLQEMASEATVAQNDEPAANPVAVRIGHENRLTGLAETSVVASLYGTHPGESGAFLGSIGPTRMDYPGTIAAVRAVARYLSRVLPS